MDLSDADYRSFLIRIWREDQAQDMQKTGPLVAADDAAGDGWLFQLEDIASGDTRYFHTTGALAGYVDEKLHADAANG